MRLYLTNAATVAAVARHGAKAGSLAAVGPGTVWCIQRMLQAFVRGMSRGTVLAFTPPFELLRSVKHGVIDFATYAARLRTLWSEPFALDEGGIFGWRDSDRRDAQRWDGAWWVRAPAAAVDDGATLICTCARGAPCHRQVVAEVLVSRGVEVVLDGVELAEKPKP